MNCKNCGTEIEEGGILCPQCGAEQSSLAEIWKRIRTLPKTVLYGTAAAVVVLIVLIFAIGGDASSAANGKYIMREDALCLFVDDGASYDDVMACNGVSLGHVSADLFFQKNLDGTAGITHHNVLWYVTKAGYQILTNRLDRAALSIDGSAVAYRETDDVLYLYKDGGKEPAVVAENVGSFAISPNGEYVAYVDREDVLYLYDGKKIKSMETLMDEVLAVSNDGERIYAVDDSVFSVNSKGEYSLLTWEHYEHDYYLNADHSQLMFRTEGGFYLCTDGKTAQPVFSSVFEGDYPEMIVPVGAGYCGYPQTYPVAELTQQLYEMEDHMYYLEEDLQCIPLGFDYVETMNEDCSRVYGAPGQALCCFDLETGELQTLAEGVWDHYLMPDETIYFETDTGLYWYKDGKIKQVSETCFEVEQTLDGKLVYTTFRVTNEGSLITEGETDLWIAENGKAELVCENILGFKTAGSNIYYFTGEDRSTAVVYTGTEAGKFKQMDISKY